MRGLGNPHTLVGGFGRPPLKKFSNSYAYLGCETNDKNG